MSASVEAMILELTRAAGPDRSVAPDQVARALEPEDWRRVLGPVRAAAVGLARQGRVVILRHNKPADPDGFKGVYRLRAPAALDEPAASPDAPPSAPPLDVRS